MLSLDAMLAAIISKALYQKRSRLLLLYSRGVKESTTQSQESCRVIEYQ